MPFALTRQAELFARAKRLVRAGYTKAEAARKVGRSRDWLMRLLREERQAASGESPDIQSRGTYGRQRRQVG